MLDLVSDDIEVDFGGGAGKREFVQNWKLDTPGSRLWSEHGKALALGCAESGDAFFSPSSVVQFDGKRDGQKDVEFRRFLDLPRRLDKLRPAGERFGLLR